jgi:type I restriction enzyme S subunit
MNKQALPEYKIAIPNDFSVYTKAGELLAPFFQIISNNIEQSRALAAIRDALLPRLMSGEIEVEEN